MKPEITRKIKIILQISGKKQKDLADYLEMSPQALANKFMRGTFSAEDLIKIAAFTNSELIFEMKDYKITFSESDIQDQQSE